MAEGILERAPLDTRVATVRDLFERVVAPAVGLEPTTKRLTAARSTTELRRSEERRVGEGRAK